MPKHRCKGQSLVMASDVEAIGIPTAPSSKHPRHVVVQRNADGWWSVIDQSEISDLPPSLQRQAISMATTVVSGIDAIGPTVTSLAIDDEVRWIGLWEARHREFACRCHHEDEREIS